jgi:hypothetical protein
VKKRFLPILIVGIVLLAGIIALGIILKPNQENMLVGVQSIEALQNATGCTSLNGMEEISKCIASRSTLYVQTGCHACATQEALFGDYFKNLNVVDCFYQRDKCSNVQYTPTWVIRKL